MRKDSEFAFPKGQSDYTENRGMTLRDYFAAKALAGISADPNADGTYEQIAAACYRAADAMLKERSK